VPPVSGLRREVLAEVEADYRQAFAEIEAVGAVDGMVRDSLDHVTDRGGTLAAGPRARVGSL